MSKWFFGLITVLHCITVEANLSERVETIDSKVMLENRNGYFVLSDGSMWKVFKLDKRSRSVCEWWRGEELIPQNYDCNPSDWRIGEKIEVYAKTDDLKLLISNASNALELKLCSHLFIHSTTKQALFAIALDPATCLIAIFNEAFNQGYEKGRSHALPRYHQGYNPLLNPAIYTPTDYSYILDETYKSQ